MGISEETATLEHAPTAVDARRATAVDARGLGTRWPERCFDVSLTIVALPLIVALGLVIALAIYLDSPGPVLYRSRRVGRGGEMFQMLKFRKMHRDAGSDPLTTSRDERFTPIGRFLAETHLDELPQIVNVLRGEMRLVGPRPELPVFHRAVRRRVRQHPRCSSRDHRQRSAAVLRREAAAGRTGPVGDLHRRAAAGQDLGRYGVRAVPHARGRRLDRRAYVAAAVRAARGPYANRVVRSPSVDRTCCRRGAARAGVRGCVPAPTVTRLVPGLLRAVLATAAVVGWPCSGSLAATCRSRPPGRQHSTRPGLLQPRPPPTQPRQPGRTGQCRS